ncbi:Pentatricopeptide repeat [Macleaya cordata]|uniref:Pentatricopeptide repeat n=1 Tax=Macleaya cordata TaxID=56857 RepID=A0A200PY27_MACCD|nr:Pentatricopeptide repeat [Macleaya cordata]
MQSSSRLIRNYISQGAPKEALLLYTQIRREGILYHQFGGGSVIIPLLLKACASLFFLYHGKTLHTELIKYGVTSNVIIGTTLISMYSKCYKIIDSHQVFDERLDQNVVTWNAMIGGYVQNRFCEEALEAFRRVQVDGFKPDEVTVASALFTLIMSPFKIFQLEH